MTTIVVLIALPEEHKTFLEVFPYKADCSVGRHVCLEHVSTVDQLRLISILAEQMGAQSAAQSAQLAVNEFKADMIVVVGIAGSISTDLRLGDICVSNEIVDVIHNVKVSSKSDVSLAPHFYHVDADLVASFAFLRSHPELRGLYNEWQNLAENLGYTSDGSSR